MRLKYSWIICLFVLLLSGCTRMDQRSELPEKKPLAVIDAPVVITKKWSQDTGDGTNHKDIRLSLAESNSILYTVDAKGRVRAIDEKNGQENWSLDLKSAVSAGPTVARQRLVVGTSDGKVITIDLKKGKIAWVSSTTSEILAAPTVDDDVVYIHTLDGGLSALSLEDGRQLWRYTHNLPPLMLRKNSSPIINNDYVITGFANGKLLAMQKNDGSIVWTQEISSPKGTTDIQRMVDISAEPIIVDDKIYAVSYQGNIASLALNNGNVIWERSVPSYAGIVNSDNVIFVSGSNGDVVALDSQNGATYWLQTDLQGRRLTKPAVMDKYLVIGDEDGNVHLLDKANGKIIGRYELDKNGIEATPIVHNNTLYVLGRGGQLIALEVC